MAFLEDLSTPATDKDTGESCVFGWPDRPLDTLPPDYPPIDPPDCYPYCEFNDWPEPDIPPPEPPIIIPPEAIEHNPLLIFNYLAGAVVVTNYAGAGGFAYINVIVSELGGLSASTPEPRTKPTQYLGGAANESDFILKVASNPDGWTGSQDIRSFELNPSKLLNAFPGVGVFLIEVQMGQLAHNVPGEIIDDINYYAGNMENHFDTNNLIGGISYQANLDRGYPTFLANFLGGPVIGVFKWYITRQIPFKVSSLVKVDNVQISPTP